MNIGDMFVKLWNTLGFNKPNVTWQNYVMIGISFVWMFLAIVKKFEPLLLLPIAFGMFIINLPGAYEVVWGTYPDDLAHTYENVQNRGLLWYLFYGVQNVIYPPLIFLGIGAMTDFGPLISNPKSMLIGAAAQLGIYIAFVVAILLGFTPQEAASIAIIGGADGPTAILVASKLAGHLLGPIALAAYSYMALIPLIQPPLMKLLTTKKEREVEMKQLRTVSKTEKIIFPVVVFVVVSLLIPDAAPLIGMLMFGNLLKVCGVTDRLSDTAQNALTNIVTIMLGVTVGATTNGTEFLKLDTIKIVFLGLAAFCFSTIGGLLFGKLLYIVTGGKINPLIGSAGVSAVPMAARVAQTEGRKYNPTNFLLMHAMGPNVAGVIGSAVAAGFLLMMFGK
jgi:oxaloacetate decarboxylase beta subunit